MRQSPAVLPVLLLAAASGAAPAFASGQPGDIAFSANIGLADSRSDDSYRSDQTLQFTVEYQKTGYAAYRATAGFMTIEGRDEISQARGTRDMDAQFVAGNFVLTPRFAVLHPFVTAGIGFYNMRLTDNLDSRNSFELGANWGFGLSAQLLRHFEVRGEAMYHYTTGKVANPIQTLTVGGRFVF